MANNNEEKMGYRELGAKIAKERLKKFASGIQIKMEEQKERRYMEKAAYQQAFQAEKEKALVELAKRRAGKYKYTSTERILGAVKPPPKLKVKPTRKTTRRPTRRKPYEIDFRSQLGGQYPKKKKSGIDSMFGRLY